MDLIQLASCPSNSMQFTHTCFIIISFLDSNLSLLCYENPGKLNTLWEVGEGKKKKKMDPGDLGKS